MSELLDVLSGCKIAVIGDVMLDSYLSGDVARISPEAPVAVICAPSERTVPGGAGNVAANLASLGVQVSLVGLVGCDDDKEQLAAQLANIGAVDCRGLVRDSSRRTTRKLRVTAGRQQIVRLDYEDSAPATNSIEADLIAQPRLAIEAADAVIVSDYGKGTCSDAVLTAERLTVGFTNRCFDLIHPGHVALIAQAAESCDRLIVAINSDASVRNLKGDGRPIQNERARADVIGGMRGVAAVMIFDDPRPLAAIEASVPDVLIKGADYRIDQVVGSDVVHNAGGRVILAQIREGHSTSRLVAASGRHESTAN